MYEISKLNTAELRLLVALLYLPNFTERTTTQQVQELGISRGRLFKAQRSLEEKDYVTHNTGYRGKTVLEVRTPPELVNIYISKLGVAGDGSTAGVDDRLVPFSVTTPNSTSDTQCNQSLVPLSSTSVIECNQSLVPLDITSTTQYHQSSNGNHLLEKCKLVDEIDDSGTPSNKRSPRRTAQIEVLIEVWSYYWPEQYPLTPKSAISLLNLCDNQMTDLYYEIKDLKLRKPDIESPLGYMKKRLSSQERVSVPSVPTSQQFVAYKDRMVDVELLDPTPEQIERRKKARERAKEIWGDDDE